MIHYFHNAMGCLRYAAVSTYKKCICKKIHV